MLELALGNARKTKNERNKWLKSQAWALQRPLDWTIKNKLLITGEYVDGWN